MPDADKLPVGPDGKPLKPCCACPDTRKARDECIVERGEENCNDLIEAHLTCLRSLGFKI
ncbi:cytochrome c oxidase copper chaperone putative [Echinococcus multilocularis]|uniref:Cytochrome c oxidase copper chaperone putative n=1 Tax=Echinococcus multilocularis TaxID=6211 RepID=A0A068YHI2_ECHMU|nr:cytochrome c oxidase copper chaperone putative [Echinococcus multilocularis]